MSSQVGLRLLLRTRCMFDDPVQVKVAGLRPRQVVTVTGRVTDEHGVVFSSSATYRADDSGEIDLERQPSLGGTFVGLEPQGLLWSMTPATLHSNFRKEHSGPQVMKFSVREVEREGRILAEATSERFVLGDGVSRLPIKQGNVVGVLFTPPDCAAGGNGYFMYADFWCAVYSREPRQVEYLVDWYFNRNFVMQYNSTVGNWTGFTPAGIITASALNDDKHDVLQRKLEKQLICVDNVGLIFNTTEENMAEPDVTLAETASFNNRNMLVCSAYDFYPKHIRVTWYLNGQEVTSGVTVSEVMTNGDWTYQVHSYLEYTPGRKDKVSCVVEHTSLRSPKVYDWAASLSQSERSYLIGGACVLVLGAVCLFLGLIQYRKKSRDPQFSSTL